jgi:sec-independent protein translocase protein TatB
MFDIGSTELLLIVVVAILVIGPKDLPRALYKLGQVVGKARGMARHFRSGIDAMIREAELEELQKQWASENERIMAATRITDAGDAMKPLADETAAPEDATADGGSAIASADAGAADADGADAGAAGGGAADARRDAAPGTVPQASATVAVSTSPDQPSLPLGSSVADGPKGSAA